jgi:hypothetical protein
LISQNLAGFNQKIPTEIQISLFGIGHIDFDVPDVVHGFQEAKKVTFVS